MAILDSEVFRAIYKRIDDHSGKKGESLLPTKIVYVVPGEETKEEVKPRLELSDLAIDPETLTHGGRSRRRWLLQIAVVTEYGISEFAKSMDPDKKGPRTYADNLDALFPFGTEDDPNRPGRKRRIQIQGLAEAERHRIIMVNNNPVRVNVRDESDAPFYDPNDRDVGYFWVRAKPRIGQVFRERAEWRFIVEIRFETLERIPKRIPSA